MVLFTYEDQGFFIEFSIEKLKNYEEFFSKFSSIF